MIMALPLRKVSSEALWANQERQKKQKIRSRVKMVLYDYLEKQFRWVLDSVSLWLGHGPVW